MVKKWVSMRKLGTLPLHYNSRQNHILHAKTPSSDSNSKVARLRIDGCGFRVKPIQEFETVISTSTSASATGTLREFNDETCLYQFLSRNQFQRSRPSQLNPYDWNVQKLKCHPPQNQTWFLLSQKQWINPPLHPRQYRIKTNDSPIFSTNAICGSGCCK